MPLEVEIGPHGRRQVTAPCDIPCPVERGMRVIGGKWTASILWHLRQEPVRFNDLARLIQGASKKMITARLRFLEDQRLVTRHVDSSGPVVTVSYALTETGQSAISLLDHLAEWAEDLPHQSRPEMPSAK